MPASTLSRVVLPEPLRPIKPTRSPCSMLKFRSLSAFTLIRLRASRARFPRVVLARIDFLRDRELLWYIGNSTDRSRKRRNAIGLHPVCDPRGKAREEGEC